MTREYKHQKNRSHPALQGEPLKRRKKNVKALRVQMDDCELGRNKKVYQIFVKVPKILHHFP